MPFDNKNNFQCHIGNLCFNASKTIRELSSLTSLMQVKKYMYWQASLLYGSATIVMLYLIQSLTFVILMCHSRALNKKIEELYEICFRLIKNNRELSSLTSLG